MPSYIDWCVFVFAITAHAEKYFFIHAKVFGTAITTMEEYRPEKYVPYVLAPAAPAPLAAP